MQDVLGKHVSDFYAIKVKNIFHVGSFSMYFFRLLYKQWKPERKTCLINCLIKLL